MPRALGILFPALAFASFLTELKLVPGLRHNIGPFEIVGACLIAALFLTVRPDSIHVPAVSKVLLTIFLAALVSQARLPSSADPRTVVQVLILLGLALVTLSVYNLARRYQMTPLYLLKLITYSVLIVGPWIIADAARTGGAITASGPFRNRAHMGLYMLTTFWIVLAYCLWPETTKRERVTGYAALALALYAVAVSGRRSVYVALIAGFIGLAGTIFVAGRGRRIGIATGSFFAVGFLALLYFYGSREIPQIAFFQDRVGMIGSRLESALGGEAHEPTIGPSFDELQRQGVKQAFLDRPLFGVGWGGFARSKYSSHEVHSTPFRFLAELGLTGLFLWLSFTWLLLAAALRAYRMARGTPYANTVLAMLVGVSSVTVSSIYNRHIHDRTFWLFIILILLSEHFLRSYRAVMAARSSNDRRAAASGEHR